MKVVVDTNVLISGVFFGGMPARVLEAWRDGKFDLVASPDILEEYRRVGEELAVRFTGVSLAPLLALLVMTAEIIEPRQGSLNRFRETRTMTSSSPAPSREIVSASSAETKIFWRYLVTRGSRSSRLGSSSSLCSDPGNAELQLGTLRRCLRDPGGAYSGRVGNPLAQSSTGIPLSLHHSSSTSLVRSPSNRYHASRRSRSSRNALYRA